MSRTETITLTLSEIEYIFVCAMCHPLNEVDARDFWEEAKSRYPHAFRDF